MPAEIKGELKKLRIESYGEPEYTGSPVDVFEAHFNPHTYSVKYAVEYEEDQGRGTTGLPQHFKQSKPSEFSLDFTIDGTVPSAAGKPPTEVATEVRHFLAVAYEYDGEIHRPRYLKVAWGTLLFNCVFKGAGVKYTLFRPDGSPLRAVISATFFGFVDDARRVAEERKSSPDLTHVHTVIDGETLPLLCQRYYGDPRHYINVAKHNRLNGFRDLEAGTRIVLPPLARSGGAK